MSNKICREKARNRCEQHNRVEFLAEQVYLVLDCNGIERIAILVKSNKILFILEVKKDHKICAFDGATLTQIRRRGDLWPRPPQCCPLQTPKLSSSCRSKNFRGSSLVCTSIPDTATTTNLSVHLTRERFLWSAASTTREHFCEFLRRKSLVACAIP